MKTLHPFQAEGVDFLLNGGKLLAFSPGLGKTVTTIEACKRRGAKTVVVICPAVALGVWRDEVLDHWPECSSVYLRDMVHAGELLPPEPRVVITGPEFLVVNTKARHALLQLGHFDVLVIDESHMMKEPTAKRTMLAFGPGCAGAGLVGRADVTWLLSGTPILNHAGEIYPAMRALAPERLPLLSYDAFTRRYCTFKTRTVRTRAGRSKSIEVIDGSNREQIPDLAKRLRGFWLIKKTEQVLDQLPPLTVQVRSLEPEMCDAEILKQVEESPEAELLRRALEKGSPEALSAIEGQLSRLRRLLALAKASATVAWVEGLLDQGVPKVVVFGWHVEALERISGCLSGLLITGSTPSSQRARIVEMFQTRPAARVLVGQIQAAGTAITLTASNRVVMNEMAWTPALNHQAIKRCHRIGTKSAVLAEVLAVRGSIDHAVAEILARKSADIEALEEAS